MATPEISESIDIFIYQPTKSSDAYIKLLNPQCIKVCIPVIYADIFCIYEEGDKYICGDSLDKYRNLSLDEVLTLYDNGEYDFELKKRFELSMQYLIEREKLCDIKVSDFILKNYRTFRLFETQNHPNGIVGSYIAKEICRFLQTDIPCIDEYTQGNIHLQPLECKDSFYAKRELQLEFIKEDNSDHYRKILIYLYNNPDMIKRKYVTGV